MKMSENKKALYPELCQANVKAVTCPQSKMVTALIGNDNKSYTPGWPKLLAGISISLQVGSG